MNKKLAKAIRILSAPPIPAAGLFLFFRIRGDLSPAEFLTGILLIGFLPFSVYLLVRERDRQRRLAFILSAAGYCLAFLLSQILKFGRIAKIIITTYFFSALFLILLNKFVKRKASGHACGVTGPMLMMVQYGGPAFLIPCVVFFYLAVRSSLDLGRHTAKELVLGSLSCLLAMMLAYLLLSPLWIAGSTGIMA